jgi:hypothetical protein
VKAECWWVGKVVPDLRAQRRFTVIDPFFTGCNSPGLSFGLRFETFFGSIERLKCDICSLFPRNYNANIPTAGIAILGRGRLDHVTFVFFSLHNGTRARQNLNSIPTNDSMSMEACD